MRLISAETSGYLYVLAAAWLWSLIGPFSKICLAEGLAPLEVAFWRAVFGGLCFFAQMALCGGRRIPLRHAAFFCGFGIVGVSLFFAALQLSIQMSGAAMAMVLMYTAPAWVAVFCHWLFKERLSGRKTSALGIAMAGTALVCFSGGSLKADPSLWGILCGLVSGICYAAHFPFYVWWKSRYSTATLYAYMLVGGAVALYPFVGFSLHYSWRAWAGLTALGVMTNYAAYLAYGQSLKLVSPVRAAVIGNIEPVLATLWVWLFWQENFSLSGWIGSALVLFAVFLLTTDRNAA